MHLRHQMRSQINRAPADDPPGAPGGAPPATPLATPPAQAAAPPAEPPKTPPAEPPKSDWKDGRIAELTAKLNREKEAREAAEAKLTTPPAAKPGESAADFEARVSEEATLRATAMASNAAWNDRCNQVAAAGREEFKEEFDKRLNGVLQLVNTKDQGEVTQYNAVLAAAMETGKAHKIIFALGEKPENFQKLMKLSPVRMAMEMGTLAVSVGGAAVPSGAPAPITPIGGVGAAHDGITPDDPERGMKMNKNAWFAEREKQAAARGLQ